MSDYLVHYFKENDRTPSWDGEVLLYKNKNLKKENIVGRVPVQIKAKSVKSFSNKFSYISIDLADLNNYLRDGGVLLFLIEICRNESKIFMSSLLPYDLHYELNNVKGGGIKVDKINDIIELERLCREFLEHRKRQHSMTNFGLNLPEHKYFEFIVTSDKEKLRNEDIVSRPQYIYGKVDSKRTVFETVKKMFVGIKDEMIEPVAIKNKYFYNKVIRNITKDKVVLTFGKCVNMVFEKGKVLSFNITPKGSIDDRIKDYEFFLNLVKEKEFSIGANTFPMMAQGIKDQVSILKELEARLMYLNNIVAVFKYFNVDHNKLNFDSLEEKDNFNLKGLMNSIIFKKSIEKQKQIPGKYFIKIGNVTLLGVIYKKFDEDRIVIDNYANLKKGMYRIYPPGIELRKNPEKVIYASPYVGLNVEEMISVDNIYPEDIYNDVINYSHSEDYDTSVSNLCLRMIKVYDETKKLEYLENVVKILKWQEEGKFIADHLIKLNQLQIVRRMGNLNADELEYLIELKKNFAEDNFILCGIHILLDDHEKFKGCFSKLNDEDKEEFLEFPIYNLIKDKL